MSVLAPQVDSPVDGWLGELAGQLSRLSQLEPSPDPTVGLARIRVLEEIKAAAGAAVLEQSVAYAEARMTDAATVRKREQARRVAAAEIAKARRASPHRASRDLGWATSLVHDLPQTFQVVKSGRTTEWRGLLVARETTWLTPDQRSVADRELAPQLEAMGDREAEAATAGIVYRLDPHAAVARIRAATGDRRVTLRPAPDTMSRLTATLPVAQGVAAYAALMRAADTATASGEPRSRGQVMADILVERLTGQASAELVPVAVNLVITDHTLLARDDEPAHLDGHGPLPAPLARDLATTPDEHAARTLRRIFTDPAGRLTAMETRQRCFTPAMRLLVRLADKHCQTPWCGAPIRHIDHKHPAGRDGPTALANAQGLCEDCNQTKALTDQATPRQTRAPNVA